MIQSPYQVGGSLSTDAPTYVKRQADDEFYHALKRGEFCYVLNARQMGKSSLMVQTQHRLQQQGYCCAAIDLSVIGSEEVTPLQWYKGIITSLSLEFDLFGEFNLKSWWKAEVDLSFIQRFSRFIDLLLEVYLPQKQIVIFIDEVDSILHLDFSVDDFFALIRSFYNQRAIHSIYNRISFAIFGVATPSDLIQDKTRTPFNIGKAIELKGFTWEEAQPLAHNLSLKSGCSATLLKEVLSWTGGQPFLTQKLCDLVERAAFNTPSHVLEIQAHKEKEIVAELVRLQIIENWEAKDEPEHLKTIQDRLLNNTNYLGRILGIYQRILQNSALEQSSGVKSDISRVKLELILSGLVVKEQGYLKVKNKIYAAIFNAEWIQQQLNQIRPYSQLIEAWKLSNYQDESRLIRGNALKEAQDWAEGKSLTDLDYRFLAASQKYEDQEIHKTLEAERAKEIEARLLEERKIVKVQKFFLEKVRQETEARLIQEQTKQNKEKEISRLQKLLLKSTTATLLITTLLLLIVLGLYFKSSQIQTETRQSELQSLLNSSEAFLASEQSLDALSTVIQAKNKLEVLKLTDSQLQQQADKILREAIFSVNLSNRFSGHNQEIIGFSFSQEGESLETFISASEDGSIKQWNREGQLLRSLVNNETLQTVAFSPLGQQFAVADKTNIIKLYNQSGAIIQEIKTASDNITQIALNKGYLAAVSDYNTVQIWNKKGRLLATVKPNQGLVYTLAFSPNGEILATGGEDGQVKLWDRQGRLLRTLSNYHASTLSHQQTVVFSPDNQLIAVTGSESNIMLYNLKGTLLTTFHTHQSIINSITFSPDSKVIAVAGLNNKIQLWSRTGNFIKSLVGDPLETTQMKFSPVGDSLPSGIGNILASSHSDGTINFWRLHHPLKQTFRAHQDLIREIKFSPDDRQFMTFCYQGFVKHWQQDGNLLQSFFVNQVENITLNGKRLLRLLNQADPRAFTWINNSDLVNRLTSQIDWIKAVAVHDKKRLIATLNSENKIQIWNSKGNLKQEIYPTQINISEITFSPDGKVLGFSNDYELELWNLQNKFRQPLVSLINSQNQIQAWSFSELGQTIAVATQTGEVKLLDRKGKLLSTIQTDAEAIVDMEINSHRQLIAIINRLSPNEIKILNYQGELLQTLSGHSTQFSNISFSPQGDTLVSASRHGEVTLWDIQSILDSDLLDLACDWIQDYLKNNQTVKETLANCRSTR
ncbi:MAG: AAA-like domain-containing protein [Microcoleaceae cyanobacterium]